MSRFRAFTEECTPTWLSPITANVELLHQPWTKKRAVRFLFRADLYIMFIQALGNLYHARFLFFFAQAFCSHALFTLLATVMRVGCLGV